MRPTTYPAKNCTIPMRFVDTNVLIYAASPSPEETEKHRRAQDLLNRDDLALSIQVLGEFYYQVTRPSRPEPLTHAQVLEFLDSISGFQVQPMTVEIFTRAVEISQRFQLSYWDGAILAAARAMGCDAVYSEDMSHQQDYAGLRVINPFT